MSGGGSSPGPIASRTFDVGFKIAVAGGLAGMGALYWSGVLSLSNSLDVVYTLTLFPVYLLAAAVSLGLWLGYDTNGSDLKRVKKEIDPESDDSEKSRP